MIMNTFDVKNAISLNKESSDYVEQVKDFKYLESMMASRDIEKLKRKDMGCILET